MSPARRIPLCIPNVGEGERAYLNQCIDTNFVSSVGPCVAEMEQRLAGLTGAAAAVTTGSGTQALRLALHLVGVRPGDLVVMPSFTFIATANAAWQAGATPLLLDIETEGWTLAPDALAELLTKDVMRDGGRAVHRPTGRPIGAVMPVYTFGNIAKMGRLTALAREWDIPVVADAAAALGSTSPEGAVAELGDLACISFNGNKIVTTGCGGAIVGADKATLDRARHLASTGRVGQDYLHDEPAFNYRMSNLGAAIGVAQLERLDGFVARKREIRDAYDRVLAASGRATSLPEPGWCRSNAWFSGAVLPQDASPDDAARLLAALNAEGVEARPFWRPVHLQPPYSDAPHGGPLTNGERFWRRVVTLPCSTGLTDDDLAYCCDALAEGLRRL